MLQSDVRGQRPTREDVLTSVSFACALALSVVALDCSGVNRSQPGSNAHGPITLDQPVTLPLRLASQREPGVNQRPVHGAGSLPQAQPGAHWL